MMCGIIGFNFNDKNLAKNMLNEISYRGPNHSNIFEDDNMTLGYNRLSIIDLKSGNQPIFNEDRTKLIFFNGEIYNYIELKKKLEKKHKFSTESDTETILHLFEEENYNFLSYLDGMFAIAIYDLKSKNLFLARDRLGVKPLYYYYHEGVFIFSSEIKPILKYELKKEINRQALSSYFSFRFCSGENTILKNIKRVMPGTFITFKNNQLNVKKYWDLNFKIKNDSLDRCISEFKGLIEESVRIRMRSDVPIGALLSGGIDSSTIVAHMRDNTENEINTYTLGFENSYNEFKYARIASEKFETTHHEFEISEKELKYLPKIIWHLDEPLGDPTAIPNYLLAKYASKKVKVLLNGEGADELFSGYEHYLVFSKIPKFNANIPVINEPICLRAASFLRENELESKYMQSYGVSVFSNLEKNKLLNYQENDKDKFFSKKNGLINNMLYRDIKTFLPDNMLLKFDRTTMANSIEGRVPFCSYKIAEFSSKIPEKFKLNRFCEKYIIKKAMEKKLPIEIIKRKKQRFFAPTDRWLMNKSPELNNMIESEKDTIKEYFNKDYVEKLINKKFKVTEALLSKNKLTNLYLSRQVWSIANFLIWNSIFINGERKKFL